MKSYLILRGWNNKFHIYTAMRTKSSAAFAKTLFNHKAMPKALAHAKGKGQALVHKPLNPVDVRKRAKLTQPQMALLMGMSLSGYRKWEQGARNISGPAATLLRIMEKEPEALRRAILQPAA